MNIPQTYDYLIQTRRDLWTALKTVPDEVLSCQLLEGERFHCIKDLLFHIAAVEDSWIHEDILRDEPVFLRTSSLKDTEGGPEYSGFALQTLLDYWQAVQESTLVYLQTLNEADLGRVVALHDAAEERYTLDGLLWHIMIHEMRHTAQIAVLLRSQGIKPPSLDLLFYLPRI